MIATHTFISQTSWDSHQWAYIYLLPLLCANIQLLAYICYNPTHLSSLSTILLPLHVHFLPYLHTYSVSLPSLLGSSYTSSFFLKGFCSSWVRYFCHCQFHISWSQASLHTRKSLCLLQPTPESKNSWSTEAENKHASDRSPVGHSECETIL